MIAPVDLTLQKRCACLGTFLMTHLTKVYILRRKEKTTPKRVFQQKKIKTGGLLTRKTLAICAPFLQKPPSILCIIKLTSSAPETPNNEVQRDTQYKTPS